MIKEEVKEENIEAGLTEKQKKINFCPNCGATGYQYDDAKGTPYHEPYYYEVVPKGQLRCKNCHYIICDYGDLGIPIIWQNGRVATDPEEMEIIDQEKTEVTNKENLYCDDVEWIKIPDLFSISVVVEEFDGFKDVHMTIFRADDKTPFDPEKYIPDSVPKSDEAHTYDYCKCHIEDHFTKDEITKIKEFLETFDKSRVNEPRFCELPVDGCIMPTSGIPFGGPVGNLDLTKCKHYPFDDLKLAAYYDLRRHEKIDPDKPANYMKVYTAGDKTVVMNPDEDYLDRMKKKQEENKNDSDHQMEEHLELVNCNNCKHLKECIEQLDNDDFYYGANGLPYGPPKIDCDSYEEEV